MLAGGAVLDDTAQAFVANEDRMNSNSNEESFITFFSGIYWDISSTFSTAARLQIETVSMPGTNYLTYKINFALA
jgi:hypothetical protein